MSYSNIRNDSSKLKKVRDPWEGDGRSKVFLFFPL